MEYAPIIGLGLLLVFIGVLTWPHVVFPWLEKRAWLELAARTGLAYRSRSFLGMPKRGRVVGRYRGRDVTLDVFKAPGERLSTRIMLSIDHRTMGVSLVLTRSFSRGFYTGDEHFDRLFSISESEPRYLAFKVFVSAGLRRRFEDVMQGLQSYNYYIEVTDHMLRFEETPRPWLLQGADRNVDRLQSLFDVLCDMAEAVENALE